MQSGTVTSPQSFWSGEVIRSIAQKFAIEVNCTRDTSELLKTCLQEKEAEELVRAAERLFVSTLMIEKIYILWSYIR